MYKIPARTVLAGRRLIHVPECHSTNSLLAELNQRSALPEGTVLITDHQLAGRGQRGNSWEAEAGKNLTFSILLRPAFLPILHQFDLVMMTGIAIAQAIEETTGLSVQLKWPNDIMMGDRKAGGILIENQLTGSTFETSIVGVGINVNQQQFSINTAVSLANLTGKEINPGDLLEQILTEFDSEYILFQTNRTSLRSRYLKRLYRLGIPSNFTSGEERFSGTLSGVDEVGRLVVSTEKGERRFMVKEIALESPNHL